MTAIGCLRGDKNTEISWDITSCRLAVTDVSDEQIATVLRVFLDCLTLKMATLRSFLKSVTVYQSMRSNNLSIMHYMIGRRAMDVWFHSLLTPALGVLSSQLHALAALTHGQCFLYTLNRKLGGPKSVIKQCCSMQEGKSNKY
jgi:hypothetical protein